MRPADLLQMVRATPFEPFRIRLNSGRTFEIRHPEMVKVGKSSAYLFTYSVEEDDVIERADIVSLLLMEAFEPIEPKRSAG